MTTVECTKLSLGTKEQEKKLLEIIKEHKNRKGALIPVLHEAQNIYGYLPESVQMKIGEGLNIPMTEVYGVVTFYTHFSMVPKGDIKISVCLGTACYVKGVKDILDKLEQKLGIKVGECTEDGKFSLDATRCLGACGLAPVMTINDDVYGKLSIKKIDGIIKKYK
jgi:NADP-reducing hydrogenase subunit HndA